MDIKSSGKYAFLGGTSSGKSALAEQLVAASGPDICYLATAPATWSNGDPEFASRVARHKERRGDRWRLIELLEPDALYDLILNAEMPTVIDSVGAWLAFDDRFEPDLDRLESAISRSKVPLSFVAEESSLGVLPMNTVARDFVDRLGAVNQRIVKSVDRSFLVVAGGLLEVSQAKWQEAR